MKLFGRIGVSVIINRHFSTFYNYGLYEWVGKRKMPTEDKLLFLIIPALISIGFVFLDPFIVSHFTDLIITALSIFVGLLFSLLTLVFELAKKEKEKVKQRQKDHVRKAIFILTKEMFVNISYAIALSILCIICVFLAEFRPEILINFLRQSEEFEKIRTITLFIVNTIVVFLLLQFFLTLLMILKRFFIVFNKEIESDPDVIEDTNVVS